MAFNERGFRTVDFMFDPNGLPGANLGVHAYVTPDGQAAIEAAGYFNALAKRVKAGDHINMTLGLGAGVVRRDYVVASKALGVVSIAPQDQGGGVPFKALVINGVPVTINGKYITIGAAA